MIRPVGFIVVVLLFSFLLYTVWMFAPVLEGVEKPSFPHDLQSLRLLAKTMTTYRDAHYYYTVLLFSLAFLFKQTFAIPGSFLMNLLAGALFGVWAGSVLSSLLTAIGSSFCFLLSALFARPIITKYFSGKLSTIKLQMATERDRIFFFLLSARVFPFTPHWLLNICSPFLGIPLRIHFSTVGLGLLPYNVLCVRAGRVISEIQSISDVFDTSTIIELLLIAVVLILVARYAKKSSSTSHLPQLSH
ncbi:unnamed protein product [Auanema sp. JU1783]|nr:unnamed protein product [Auanema sp. JU1783]